MATIGNTAKPTSSQEWFGVNTGNQQAQLITMPENGDIYRLGGWVAGVNSAAEMAFCLWNAAGGLVAWAPGFNATGLAFGMNNSIQYESDLTTPVAVTGGANYYVGWWRNPAHSHQFGRYSSGTHLDDAYTPSSSPGDLTGNVGDSGGAISAYAYYTTNVAPNPAANLSPGSNTIVTDTTPAMSWDYSDNNGDALLNFTLRISPDAAMSGTTYSVANSTAFTAVGNRITHNVTSALARGVPYWWRVVHTDVPGLTSVAPAIVGPFYVNSLPVISGRVPLASALAAIHNLADAAIWAAGGASVTLQTSAAADDIVDATAHGLSIGDSFEFVTLTGGAGLTVATTYYVTATSFGANTLRPSLAPGGTAINFTTDITAGTLRKMTGYSKPTLTWLYSDANGHASSKYRVRVYSAATAGALLYDSGDVSYVAASGASMAHNATWAGVLGTEYWWTAEVWDSLSESSGESSRTAFKMRWAQAIYEHAVGVGSGNWLIGMNWGTQASSAFLYRSATGAGGVGAGAWQTSIGAAYSALASHVQVMVRLATPGSNPTLNDMTVSYLGSATTPDRWASTPAGEWTLDPAVRRFGSQSYRCAVVAGVTGDRSIYPFRVTSGDDVLVSPNTIYTMSAFVKTSAPLTGGSLRLRVYEAGALTTVVAESAAITDTGPANEGWQRVTVTFTTTAGITKLRPALVYVRTAGVTETFWTDAWKLEEGPVASAWSPGFVGDAIVLDSNGIQVDAAAGGIFRARGSIGAARDSVEVGPHALLFGSDVEVYSPAVGRLSFGGATGFLTPAYIGYNTIGALWDTLTQRRQHATSVTLADAGLLTSIDMYIKGNGGNVENMSVGVFTDSSGSPGTMIAAVPMNQVSLFLTATARWFSAPVGVWLPAATYWLMCSNDSSVAGISLAYDSAGGSDKYNLQTGDWIGDVVTPWTAGGGTRWSIRGTILR